MRSEGAFYIMKLKITTMLFIGILVLGLAACGGGGDQSVTSQTEQATNETYAIPEPERPVEVNRTYEKIDSSPAVEAPSYDLNLKIDTENDRITEVVRIDIQNNTNVPVDSVYLRYYPMGYFDYLCETHPDVSGANKDKKAEITGIRFDGADKELSAEYYLDNTSVKVNLADAAMQPGESRTLVVEAMIL